MENIAMVILAAGPSSRLGRPKQLLDYKGTRLLNHVVGAALDTGCRHVFLVLGAHMELMKPAIKEKPVILVENSGWEEGMASSIRCGVKAVMNTLPEAVGIIFMVCDQPFVSHALLLKLMQRKKETGMPIVACSYGHSNEKEEVGIPALFHQDFFPALLELKGDRGARKLILDYPGKVATVPFPEGVIDIDTEADVELLKKEREC